MIPTTVLRNLPDYRKLGELQPILVAVQASPYISQFAHTEKCYIKWWAMNNDHRTKILNNLPNNQRTAIEQARQSHHSTTIDDINPCALLQDEEGVLERIDRQWISAKES